MDYKQYIKNLLINNKDGLLKTNKNKTTIALVEILEEEITNFNYDDIDLTYLFTLFDMLVKTIDNNEALKYQLNDRFTYIHNMIKNILHVEVDKKNKNQLSKYRILQNIINKMENTMLRIYYDNPLDYDPDKKEFIDYIIFDLKYINCVNNAVNNYPHLANSVNKDGIPLIEQILEEYLSSLKIYLDDPNLGPLDDLIYYDKVFSIFINSEKLKIDDFNKNNMLNKINSFYESTICLTNRHKEKLTFFINNIQNKIYGFNEPETIDYLNYKYEVHGKFKEAHISEANKIYYLNSNIEKPTTSRKIYTFDGEDAKELDDGLSIIYEDGIYHLGVHIADPTAYIPFNSILMDEAKRRTTSLYMGSYCIPLYPFNLSGDLMSLNVGKNTYCMSYYFDIDELSGELINFEIKPEICSIAGNLTYDYFNECLDHGSDDYDFFNTLINLANVSEILKKVYNEDEVYNQFHNDKDRSISTSIVESAMIYTNYQIAKLFSNRNLPFIYRCHKINEKDIKRLNELQNKLKEKDNTTNMVNNIEMLKNLFPRAYYTRFNEGHYGLGIDFYSHSTSPLRRLADNIVNICIKNLLLKEPSKEQIKEMEENIDRIAELINNKRASLDDYQIQHIKTLHKKIDN